MKEDMTIIGHINMKNINNVDEKYGGDSSCLRIQTDTGNDWVLCSSSQTENQEWYCAIGYAIKKPCDGKGSSKGKGGLDDLVGT